MTNYSISVNPQFNSIEISFDEAAERVRLVDDIRAHRRARRERVAR